MRVIGLLGEAAFVYMGTFALRWVALSEHSLSADEIFSWVVSHFSPAKIIAYLAQGNNPPLWELLLHLWRKVGGDSEAALRGLSVVWSAGAGAILYLLGRFTGGRIAGAVSAFCWAFSNLGQSLAHEARAYSLLAALVALSHFLFLKWIRTGRSFFLWILSLWLLLYTHYMGLWVALLQIGFLAFRGSQHRGQLWRSLQLLGVGLGFQALIVGDRLFHPSEVGYGSLTSWEGLYNMLWQFSNAPVPTVLAIGVMTIVTVYRFWKEGKLSWEIRYAYGSFLGIFLLLWGVSWLLRLWHARYALPAAIGYYWVMGLSVGAFPRYARWVAGGLVGLAWIVSWRSDAVSYPPVFREVGAWIERKPLRQPLIVSPSWQVLSLAYPLKEVSLQRELEAASDPFPIVSRRLYVSHRILGANYWADLPPCEIQAADTLWWLDHDYCFDFPNGLLPDRLCEDFVPVRIYRFNAKVSLWMFVSRKSSAPL
ncbi:MAG: glycosyltransferase family 39 protein [Bacteroidia bacterium]|nr:glycosyltransferase family 39 protein [Bacteroidia bacterium]